MSLRISIHSADGPNTLSSYTKGVEIEMLVLTGLVGTDLIHQFFGIQRSFMKFELLKVYRFNFGTYSYLFDI